MKVSSAPFEPPVVAPQASVRSLDSATQASLSRLASLIRSQVKASEVADDAAKSDARREEADAKARDARTVNALRSIESTGSADGLSREMVSRQNYPAVERVERQMKEVARQRGARIYKEIRRADVTSLIAAISHSEDKSKIAA